MIALTTEEQAELTPFNAVAFDLYRMESAADGMTPPCWLVMNAEAKERYRVRACNFLRISESRDFGGLSNEIIEHRVNGFAELADMVTRWGAAELAYKRARARGNPRAFFAE